MAITLKTTMLTTAALLQATTCFSALRYGMKSREKALWLLLGGTLFFFSAYCISALFSTGNMFISVIGIARELLLCAGSFVLMILVIITGKHASQDGTSHSDTCAPVAEELAIAVREKDILLKEIHHRVKNNLQVIASILDLSSIEVSGSTCEGLFNDAIAKISTMAIIHSQLYQSERFDRISMEDHLNEIVFYLKNFYENGTLHQYEMSIHNGSYITLNQGVPVTLILTELISNSLKHAFPDKQRGTIKISFNVDHENNAALKIVDNGRGIVQPSSDVTTDTMGLVLVRNLVQDQLKGVITITGEKGTDICVTFPFEEVHDYTESNGCR